MVLRTSETGKRASQLLANPGVQRITKGMWAVRDEPLTPVERSLLLQQHLGAPGSTLSVTGFNALDVLQMPVGYTDHWVHQSLKMPLPRIARNFAGERDTAHLRWSGARTQSVAPGIKFSKINGRTFYLDLAWPEARMAVEYNGRVHAENVDRYRDEMYRFALLRDAGWDVTLLVKGDLKEADRRHTWVEWVRRGTRSTIIIL